MVRRNKSAVLVSVTVRIARAEVRGSPVGLVGVDMLGACVNKFTVRGAAHMLHKRDVEQCRKLTEEDERARQDRKHANLERRHSRWTDFDHRGGGLAAATPTVKTRLRKCRPSVAKSIGNAHRNDVWSAGRELKRSVPRGVRGYVLERLRGFVGERERHSHGR